MGRQNEAKIDPKTEPKFKNEKVASRKRFVPIWGRLVGGLEEKEVCFSFRLKAFREMDVFEQDRCPRAIQERKRATKGAKRDAKRDPRGTKSETKKTTNL